MSNDPVWDKANMQDKLTKLAEQQRDKALEHKTDLEAFRALHGALTRDGALTVDRVLQVAQKHNVKTTREDVAAIFAKYDADKNASLELKEFAAWWGTATDGLSVLLRNALSEAILAPGVCEQWKRGNSIRIDTTSGKVDDAFEPRSGIYVTLVPSSESALKEVAGADGAAASAGDEGGKVPQGVAVVKLACKSDATDEDIQQLLDLVNVVSDEMTESNPEGAPARLKLSKVFENGKRMIKVQATVLNVPQDPSKMIGHLATLAGLKDQPLFKRFMFGIEFGVDGSHIFAPLPKGALSELFENFRMSAQFEYDDALLKILTVLSLTPDGLDEDSFAKFLAATFLARGARSVHLTSNFRSHKEVVDALIDSVAKVPFSKRKAKNSEELYSQAMAATIIRTRLEGVLGLSQVRSTLINALPQFEMMYGEVPEPKTVSVVGPPGSGKTALIKALGGVENGPFFNKQQIFFDKRAGKQHIMYVEQNGMVTPGNVLACIDGSTEESLAASLRLVSSIMASNEDLSPTNFIFVATKTAGGAASEASIKRTLAAILGSEEDDSDVPVVAFDGVTAPSKIVEQVGEDLEDFEEPPAGAEGGEGEGEGDDDEDGPSMMAIAKKAFKGFVKCIAGLEEVEFTNNVVSAHVLFENLPLGDVLSETDPEKIRRNRMEVMYRVSSIFEFNGYLGDVSELAEAWETEEEEKPSSSAKRGGGGGKRGGARRRNDSSDDDLCEVASDSSS